MSKSITDIPKSKRGRKVTTGRGVATMLRLHEPLISALDAFIAVRPDPKPSRPEMIREILKASLKLIEDGNAALHRELK
jgi:hypothetical protein